MSEVEDIRQTLLYRNTKSVEAKMKEQEGTIGELLERLKRLENNHAMMQGHFDTMNQRLNLMFAEKMGTSRGNYD